MKMSPDAIAWTIQQRIVDHYLFVLELFIKQIIHSKSFGCVRPSVLTDVPQSLRQELESTISLTPPAAETP